MIIFSKTALIAILLALASTPVAGQPKPPVETNPVFQFQFLYEQCADATPFCAAYISGLGDMMALIGSDKSDAAVINHYGICPSGGVRPTGKAMIQAVMSFGRNHPEMWNFSTIVPVMLALQETWPCK